MDLTDFKGIVKNLTQSAEERAIARALQFFSKGQIDRAISVMKEAQAKAPDDVAVLFELGRFLSVGQRAAEAAEAFRAILRRDPQLIQKISDTIEELRMGHAQVGPIYDAIAEHYVRQDNPAQAAAALEHMRPEEIRAALPRYQAKYTQGRKSAKDGKLTKTVLLPAYQLALLHEALRETDKAVPIYRDIVRTNPDESARVLPRLEALAARDYQNADLRLEVAALLLEGGRIDEAVKNFGLALETTPHAGAAIAERISAYLDAGGDNPVMRWLKASALMTIGDAPGAIEAMRPLVASGTLLDQVIGALQPLSAKEKQTDARRLLAEAFSKRNQPHQALGPLLQISEEEGLPAIEESLKTLVESHPGLGRAHQLLSDIHLEAGRSGDAIASLGRARDLAPKEAASLLPRLAKALANDRNSRDAHLMLVDMEMQGGDLEHAIVVLRHLVRVVPEAAEEALKRLIAAQKKGCGPRALIGAADACLALKQYPEALQHLEAVAGANPEMSAEFLHSLGLLIERAPDLAGRIVTLLEALEPRSPLPVAVHFARGLAQFRSGQLQAATASFREVLQSAPERVGEVRAALETFDRADPRAAEARYLLASIYLDQNDHQSAVRELTRPGPTNAALLTRVLRKYDEILVQAPQDLGARAGLLQALILARQFDRVLEVGRDTLKIRDDQSTARVSITMGEALHEKGDSDGAVRRYFAAYRRDPALAAEVIEKLRHLIDLEGKHPFACLALGKVLAHEGRGAEAVEALRAAREADPQLHDSVVQEMEGLVRSCPTESQPGLALITILQESGQNARAVQAISTHLDSHPDAAQRLAAHLDEILKAEPGHPLAQYELGRALQKLKAHARSAERFKKAATLDAALASMALRRLQEILIAEPSCTAAWLASADLLSARGQPMQAAERLAEAIARSPKEAAGLLNRLEELNQELKGQGDLAILLAGASLQTGQYERAARAYGEAVERDLAFCEDALLGLDAVIKASPRMGEGYLTRARIRLRMSQGDAALQDFSEAARLAPRLQGQILKEIETLVRERPDWSACAVQLADLYADAGRAEDAEAVLSGGLEGTPADDVRLQMLLRLARFAAERHDDSTARERMREATSLAKDRNAFLAQLHDMQVGLLRRRIAQLRERSKEGRTSAGDLSSAVQACIDLGDVDEAQRLMAAHGDRLDAAQQRRLRAALAIRRGDFPRASDQLKGLGPSELLAFGALRAGNYPLAVETLESLLARDADPRMRSLLERTYRDMVAADLMGGSRRLQAETSLLFGEGAAA